MEHSFDTEIATEYGIECAILLKNIYFWIEKNRANEKHFHDGNYWTYNSIKAFTELFPYISEKKARNALKKLENNGLIITGNYNKLSYDRTTWYAVTDKGKSLLLKRQIHLPKSQMEIAKRENGNCQKVEPIPDINPDIKPYEDKYNVSFESFWKNYPRKKEKAKAYKCYQARLKDGYSEDELLTACNKYAEECKKEKKEERYIKLGATFLGPNTPFTDYLKGSEENATEQTDDLGDWSSPQAYYAKYYGRGNTEEVLES